MICTLGKTIVINKHGIIGNANNFLVQESAVVNDGENMIQWRYFENTGQEATQQNPASQASIAKQGP
jgi:hypothetical protein